MLDYKNKILFVGYGAVAQCALPVLVKHIKVPVRDITVMEAIKIDAGFFKKLKKDPSTLLGILHGIGTVIPGSDGCATTERIG